MAITISIEISRTFDVNASPDQAYELLADVPRSAAHFPKVDQLVDLGNNSYRWEMKKIGVDKHAIQTIYACHYEADPASRTIRWTPVKGEGNGTVQGEWKIEDNGKGGTTLRFHTTGELSLPLPGILKLAVSPVVKHEFNALVDTYVENLKAALNG
ncbi:SRPBCC family protein [Hahella sp. SMD15-11]|uniref:SRPBCC family protein n=1 Tax=Thermohahella caldifontis TaxID=3142973 RepID=A0AB39UWH5_9GAMM